MEIDRTLTRKELYEMANDILRQAGLDRSGRPLEEVPYEQKQFEQNMQLGAYSTNGARKR